MNLRDFKYINPDPGGMSFRFISSELAIEFWELLAPYVSRVVNKACHGEFTIESVKRLVKSGGIVLGVASKNNKIVMVIGAEEVFYPDARAINILAMAGSGVDEFNRTILPTFVVWAKSRKIDWIECSVSPSMERLHKRYGFVTFYRNMRYKIKDDNDITK